MALTNGTVEVLSGDLVEGIALPRTERSDPQV